MVQGKNKVVLIFPISILIAALMTVRTKGLWALGVPSPALLGPFLRRGSDLELDHLLGQEILSMDLG